MAAFIASQRAVHGIPQAVSCRALGVSQSWYCKWRHGDRSPRRRRRERLDGEVARLFAASGGVDGAPRITADLRDAGWRVSQNTVAAAMAGQGLYARPGRRGKRGTTRQGKGRWRAPDRVARDFAAAAVNSRWFGDHTEIVTDEGKLHLASVLDAAARRVLGFSLSDHHDADNAYGALAIAVAVRGGQVAGVIMHTDQGSEGGFNRSSQHLDHGGARWDAAGSSCRSRRRVHVGSGQRIGRCGRRCGHLAGLSPHVRCSGSSGG